MKTIWKYGFENGPSVTHSMPKGAQILHVDVQESIICFWALVDSDAQFELRDFQVFGSGHPIDVQIKEHLGTVLVDQFVWHVFEVERL